MPMSSGDNNKLFFFLHGVGKAVIIKTKNCQRNDCKDFASYAIVAFSHDDMIITEGMK